MARRVTLGLAGPAQHPDAIRLAVEEARRCADALVALGRRGQAATMSDLGFVGLLLATDGDVAGYVQTTLGELLGYDEQRGTALLRTLEQYYTCSGSAGRTAEALHVHINTVTQRQDRIGQLLGETWRHPDRALELQLTIRLHRLSGADQ